jgi:hypothetical protein
MPKASSGIIYARVCLCSHVLWRTNMKLVLPSARQQQLFRSLDGIIVDCWGKTSAPALWDEDVWYVGFPIAPRRGGIMANGTLIVDSKGVRKLWSFLLPHCCFLSCIMSPLLRDSTNLNFNPIDDCLRKSFLRATNCAIVSPLKREQSSLVAALFCDKEKFIVNALTARTTSNVIAMREYCNSPPTDDCWESFLRRPRIEPSKARV